MDDNSNNITRCERCILPQSYPGLTFDESGVCSKCRAYERRWGNFDFKKSEEYIKNVFEAAKRKHNKYDCLIGLSGGKDSSYALYLCTEKYKLKPLCLTFNNGFLSAEASENIKKQINKLNLDHITFEPDWELMKRLYRHFLLTTGEFCTPCNTGIISSLYDTANKYNIPLIISGFSPRTDTDLDNKIYHDSTEYFQNVAKGFFSKSEIKDFLHGKTLTRALYHLTGRIRYITLPLYVKWDEEEIIGILERQLDWRGEDSITTEHTDCIASSLKEYLRIKEFGFSEKTTKFSVLVRTGLMSREEALAKVEAFEAEKREDKSGLAHKVMRMLDLSEEAVAKAITKRQSPYIPKFAKLLEKDTLLKKLYYKY
jgi:N-acetyl sugar amidotransferase